MLMQFANYVNTQNCKSRFISGVTVKLIIIHWFVIIQNHFHRFMSDQEAWHELCNLYMAEGEFAKAAFCMEELLLHNPHSHLYHQRLAEIRYTMVNRFSSPIRPETKTNSIYIYFALTPISLFLLNAGRSREYRNSQNILFASGEIESK